MSAGHGSVPETGAARSTTVPRSRASTGRARSFVVEILRGWQVEGGAVDDAELVVSELVTNAFLHGRAPEVTISLTDTGTVVRLVVSHHESTGDDAATLTPLTARAEETHGRGLAIVDVLASGWGVAETAGERRVWAELVAARVGLLPVGERDTALGDLADTLGPAPDARAVGDTVTAWVRDRLAASFAGIALLEVTGDGGPDRLHYLSVEPLPPASAAAWARFAADTNAPAAAAFREARPFFHESRTAAVVGFPELGPALAASEMAALAHLPLLDAGRAVGTLAIAWSHGRELDIGDRSWLAAVAAVTAAALIRVGVRGRLDALAEGDR